MIHKTINSELVQAAIRKSSEGENLALVAAHAGDDVITHILVFQDKDANAVAKALRSAGIDWRQIEVKKSDFYEPRTM